MFCSIHEDHALATNTFEITEPIPPLSLQQFATSLVELLTEHRAITEIETATLVLPSEVGHKSKTIDRLMINLNSELTDPSLDYTEIIRSAADALFMQR
jgi:hypothetical protein